MTGRGYRIPKRRNLDGRYVEKMFSEHNRDFFKKANQIKMRSFYFLRRLVMIVASRESQGYR